MNIVKLPDGHSLFDPAQLNIAIAGAKQSGKSTVARLLGDRAFRVADTARSLYDVLTHLNPILHAYSGGYDEYEIETEFTRFSNAGKYKDEFPHKWDAAKLDSSTGDELRRFAAGATRMFNEMCPGFFEAYTLEQAQLKMESGQRGLVYISVRNERQWQILQALVPGIKLWFVLRPDFTDSDDYTWAAQQCDYLVANSRDVGSLSSVVNQGIQFGEAEVPSGWNDRKVDTRQSQLAKLTKNYYDALKALTP